MGDFLYFMLQSSLLIGLVLFLGRKGKRSLSPRTRYMLWLIPMIRLLIPFPIIELSGNVRNWHPYAAVMQAEQFVTEQFVKEYEFYPNVSDRDSQKENGEEEKNAGSVYSGVQGQNEEKTYLEESYQTAETDAQKEKLTGEEPKKENLLNSALINKKPKEENLPNSALINKEPKEENLLNSDLMVSNPGLMNENLGKDDWTKKDLIYENLENREPADESWLNETLASGIKRMAWSIWLIGAGLLGSVFVYRNYQFFKQIKRQKRELGDIKYEDREERITDGNGKVPLQVYYVKGLESPCLAGLIRPVILVNDAALVSQEVLSMVIRHEQMHWRQKDHIWTFVRNALCIVYWFHPLVWMGAEVCRKDAELSCDSLVTAKMKKQEKIQYGMALLTLLEQKKKGKKKYGFLNGTTAMMGGKKEMEERISGIAKRTKTKRGVAGLLVLVLMLTALIGCTKIQNQNLPQDTEGLRNTQENPTDAAQTAGTEQTGNTGEEQTAKNTENTETEETIEDMKTMAQSGRSEEVEITKKEALFSGATTLGADEPLMQYIDSEVMIFSGYFGLVVLQHGKLENLERQEVQIVDTLDLKEIGCNMTQGDSAAVIRVSQDGKQVYLYQRNSDVMYRYDRVKKRLYQGDVSMLPQEEFLYKIPETVNGTIPYRLSEQRMESAAGGQKNMPYETEENLNGENEQNSIPYEGKAENGQKNMPYEKEEGEEGQKNVPYIEEVQHGGYFSYSGWDIESLEFVMDGDMVLPVWTDASKAYMKNLKKQLEDGADTVVDEGWNGVLPREVQDLREGEPLWQQVVSQVDENGDKIANRYEWTCYFEKLDGTRRLAFRSFDELLYTYGENLIFRYDQTIYVQKEYQKNPFLSFSAQGGSTAFYSGDGIIGVYDGQAISFYDEKFQLLHTVKNVRLEEYSEGYYCVLNLDTGLYGYLDNHGNTAIPFQYSLAKGFHNGYAAVLTGAKAEVYYENEYKDKSVKLFNNKGGLWGIIDKEGKYAVLPEEKYSNSFDREDLESHTTLYVNGPVCFDTVREDGTVDFIRLDDQFVLYTVKVRE